MSDHHKDYQFVSFHQSTCKELIGWQGLGGPPTKAMLLWLGSYLSIVVGFRPRFHSVLSRPLCKCLVKKINQGTDVLTHNCLPPLLALCVLKHVCTRLIILTGSKNSHKIKIAVASWQSAVGSRHPPLRPQICFFIISENADRIDCMRREGVCENVGSVLKWTSRYY